jgi:hypothetical protein
MTTFLSSERSRYLNISSAKLKTKATILTYSGRVIHLKLAFCRRTDTLFKRKSNGDISWYREVLPNFSSSNWTQHSSALTSNSNASSWEALQIFISMVACLKMQSILNKEVAVP